MNRRRVSVVGLGKLGAPLLAVLATHFDVVGIDQNLDTIRSINGGDPPAGVVEPGLADLLAENRGHYTATHDYDAVIPTEATFVIVPTPSNFDGSFNIDRVCDAVRSIGKALRGKTGSHLVVITSTVSPGATAGRISEALAAVAGGRRVNDGTLHVCYSPEFIALGQVVHDLQHPDMILIGQSTTAGGDQLEGILTTVARTNPPVARLTVIEAEIVKLSVNAFVTMKVSFANTLAEMCEGIRGADAQRVAAAIGLDPRIGNRYLQPATKFAGPCFPRDAKALLHFAHTAKTVAPLAEATAVVNDRQADRLANTVESVAGPGQTIGVFGMAYKPGTPVLDESVGVALVQELHRRGVRVVIHDPLAREQLIKLFQGSDGITVCDTADETITRCDVAVITQPCNEYRTRKPLFDRKKKVVDVWAMFNDPTYLRPGIHRWGQS